MRRSLVKMIKNLSGGMYWALNHWRDLAAEKTLPNLSAIELKLLTIIKRRESYAFVKIKNIWMHGENKKYGIINYMIRKTTGLVKFSFTKWWMDTKMDVAN
jgi:hypothetical protein